eukprot:CAMPEP_0113941928 /NCGR_PEP_ID=MMETSP1339-20121228/7753_1 /TAXON_ID=94617 /ORGANISM="Fibrocapsa japonica" /LENGTH=115 /DNA_ID=CAMNT_0000946213 /DNA_START=182 /DNA_END=532 /DNA_ORIENTATION=+ /assembly_acc=CAM_ASM_000762
MTCIDNFCDVLVAFRGLLHHKLRAGHANRYVLLGKLVENIGVAQVPPGLCSAAGPAGPVAGGPEGFLQALLRARHHVTAGSHGASNEDWLTYELVVHWDQWVVGWEGSGGPLAVD